MPAASPAEERFWCKVDQNGPMFTDGTRCWLWLASRDSNGYGHFWYEGRVGRAHRFAYEHFVGPVPDGLTIDHLCRNRACANPLHLEAVTNRENILRGVGFSARAARVTHCPQGHEYSDENTYYSPNHGRKCRECNRVNGRAHYRRRAAA